MNKNIQFNDVCSFCLDKFPNHYSIMRDIKAGIKDERGKTRKKESSNFAFLLSCALRRYVRAYSPAFLFSLSVKASCTTHSVSRFDCSSSWPHKKSTIDEFRPRVFPLYTQASGANMLGSVNRFQNNNNKYDGMMLVVICKKKMRKNKKQKKNRAVFAFVVVFEGGIFSLLVENDVVLLPQTGISNRFSARMGK